MAIEKKWQPSDNCMTAAEKWAGPIVKMRVTYTRKAGTLIRSHKVSANEVDYIYDQAIAEARFLVTMLEENKKRAVNWHQ